MGKIKCFIRDAVVKLCGGYPCFETERCTVVHHNVNKVGAAVTVSYASHFHTDDTLTSSEKMMVAQRLAAELVPHINYHVERDVLEPQSYTIYGSIMLANEGSTLIERHDRRGTPSGSI